MGQKEVNSKIVNYWTVEITMANGDVELYSSEVEPVIKDGVLVVILDDATVMYGAKHIQRAFIEPVLEEDGTPISLNDVGDMLRYEHEVLSGDRDE